MIHYATYFDRHYLSRGLALHRSLARHSPSFLLWVLCLDDETHRVLSSLGLEHVVLVRLAELERADRALRESKDDREPIEYYWTCGPAFLLYLLKRDPQIDLLTYLDADLFFFGDPTPLYEELGADSILVVEMRRPKTPREPRRRERFGAYNVGLVAFRRTAEGLACLEWWRERCIEWCFNRREDGRFGDQKYLDEWPARFRRVAVVKHQGAGLAPWNLISYRYRRQQGRVFVDADPLIFYHFSDLRVVNGWLFDVDVKRRFGYPLDPLIRRHVYFPYLRELRSARGMIREAGGVVSASDNVRKQEPKIRLLARTLRHRSFLVVTDRVAF